MDGGGRVLSQRALVELEALGIEIQRRHVAKVPLMLRAQVQAARGARHDRERRSRRGDVPCR